MLPGNICISKVAVLKFRKYMIKGYGDDHGGGFYSKVKKKHRYYPEYKMPPVMPPVTNLHKRIIQYWNKFYIISIFIDPLFFCLLTVQKENKCIRLNETFRMTLVVLRSCTILVYLLRLLLQIVLLVILPGGKNSNGANYAKDLLRTTILIQYIPRLFWVLPFLAGQSPIGFIFKSAWTNFPINMPTFLLAGHLVGSAWYLFGLQRVNQRLHDAYNASRVTNCIDKDFTDCEHGINNIRSDMATSACLSPDGFAYGIHAQVVHLNTIHNVVTRYIYSLYSGFHVN